ncbi:Mannose-6-phosphate isomerase [Lodderomyces elongisporus]|uniref:Mannose-6-phosphate isomerase n=1 Tax=Lodderomyces elongisporus TaxID=36914 RepID=UPI00291D886C|nr:Mannose-6-phosphate isomerase [Lodderomyces elongisporus]WLF79582.1 Mannose-6-phosphate isomerase [Lodderomyces elongisporus]
MSDKLFRLQCGYQNYDWGKIGSSSAVAQFAKNSDPSIEIDESKPYAELWMGTHPSVPSQAIGFNKTLRELITEEPKNLLGDAVIQKFGSSKELPFLFKVLSIEKVLSIQAHPDKKLGAQLHAQDPKNYPDDNHKPEMAIAVTDFEGFCGFKPVEQILETLQTVSQLRNIIGEEISEEFAKGIKCNATTGTEEDKTNRELIQKVFSKLMNTDDSTINEAAQSLVKASQEQPEIFAKLDARLPELIQRMNKQFPNDIGLFCGCLLLNHVNLNKGEAMFLQAKDPHAYICGDIIECMAASDNVVRAGFTPKFKDVKNLVEMLTYASEPVEKQKMTPKPFAKSHGDAKTSSLYDPPIEEFSVLQTVFDKTGGKQTFDAFDGPSIIIATNGSGTIQITGDDSTKQSVETGYVYFVAPNTAVELTASDSQKDGLTTYRAFVEV